MCLYLSSHAIVIHVILDKFLTKEASEKLVDAFISSRFMYNVYSLLYSLPNYPIQHLQRIHNTAAWILTLTSKYDHITVLKILH